MIALGEPIAHLWPDFGRKSGMKKARKEGVALKIVGKRVKAGGESVSGGGNYRSRSQYYN